MKWSASSKIYSVDMVLWSAHSSLLSTFLLIFLPFFLAALQAVYESLIPQPGIKPQPPPFKAQSPNHLMATETPSCFFSVLWVFLYTLGTNPLSDKCVLNIFSHYVAYLFILLMLP